MQNSKWLFDRKEQSIIKHKSLLIFFFKAGLSYLHISSFKAGTILLLVIIIYRWGRLLPF